MAFIFESYNMKETKFVSIFIGLVFILLISFAFIFNGTGDSGDSIMHFLYAKYAFKNPDNFFNVWAKPLYVLLASPFAQLGFTGIKIFNSINTTISMIATYLVAKRFNLKHAWLVPILLMLAPMNFALSLTGLTEPLFAGVLISGLCLLFYEYTIIGLVLLSFLPFVRSEGMFLLAIIAIYLIQQKKIKGIAWLFTGQIIYAIAGYFHFGSLFWFYHGNPYSIISKYGSGALNTYFINLPLIAGPASCFLLALGFVTIPIITLKERLKGNAPQLMLIWVLFTSYFFFHVIAWTFGLFDSLGMPRIIDGIMPLIILLCVYGFNQIEEFTKEKLGNTNNLFIYASVLVISINSVYMIARYSGNIGTAGFDLKPSTDELVENKMADYIKQKYPDYKNLQLLYNAPYLSLALDIDPVERPTKAASSTKLYIWDDWYSAQEGKTTLNMLQNDKTYIQDTVFTLANWNGNEKAIALFYSKESK